MPPQFTLPHVEDSPRRIRVLFGGSFVVDTKCSKLVSVARSVHFQFSHSCRWEHPYYPVYYFPLSEVSEEYLKQSVPNGDEYDLVAGGRCAASAAKMFTDGALAGLIKITFSAVDAWFEEEEQIYGHPKDPYKVNRPESSASFPYTSLLARRCSAILSSCADRDCRCRGSQLAQAETLVRDWIACQNVHSQD
jgi:hypothetical protein